MKYQGISIIKRKDCNSWCARFRKNGKQFYVSAKTQKECYEKLKSELKKQSKLEKNISKIVEVKEEPKEKEITFIEWYNTWLKLYKQNVKESTIRDYNFSLKYVKTIYNKPLKEITSIELLEIINGVKYERTKQKVYELINDIFAKALINEVISKNPMLVIQKPKHTKINGTALSNEDEKTVEKYLIKNNLDMFLVCLYQGLRRGEMLALTINDIDFKNKTISVNKSLTEKGEFSCTKNIYSNRKIPLFDKTLKILEKYKNTSGRIFNITHSSCVRRYYKMLEELNLKQKYTIHSFRHTFITRCQENNIPLHIIQKWVGHNIGSKVTNSVYTHSREIAELENIDKINNYMNNL